MTSSIPKQNGLTGSMPVVCLSRPKRCDEVIDRLVKAHTRGVKVMMDISQSRCMRVPVLEPVAFEIDIKT